MAVVAALAAVAHADDDIDVDRAELLEVVETTDGSIWKGVIIELVPGASIKIALSGGSVHVIPLGDIVRITREQKRRRAAPARHPRPIETITEPRPARPGLPAPFATSGMRLGIALLAVSPTKTWREQSRSTLGFAPSIQLAFERVHGKVAFSGGGRATWIYFLTDEASKDAFWTLETHGYLRTTVHAGAGAFYAGLSLGLDTNYSYFTSVRNGYLRVGPGLTIEGGADIAVSSGAALGLAGVFHPGTTEAAAPDQVSSEAAPDVSYIGVRIGTTLRF